MTGLIVLPILLPALVAPFLILALGYDLRAQRIASIGATLLFLALAAMLYGLAGDGTPRTYRLGDWPAPFGIVLVLDRLAATMLVLTGVLASVVVVHAAAGWDARGRHFHPLFQFQLMGLAGAFLTGDVFNLFVFFEVMLIASYGLMLHGGGAERMKAGFQYVALNLVASTLFLFAVGLLYAVTGTLNIADLAVKATQVPAGDRALLTVGAALLAMVFALKAAAVPLHWWLPAAYPAASAPAAALFMVMTKVGIYALIRVHGLAFPDLAAPWLTAAGLLGLAIGAIGALAARRLAELVAYGVVWSMGGLLVALAVMGAASAVDSAGTMTGSGVAAGTAVLYYAVHSTLAGAALFLLAGLVAAARGSLADRLVPGGPPLGTGPALLFLLAAIGFTGLPPLSGFLGKVMILQATAGDPHRVAIWSLLIGSGLPVMIGFARAGSTLFWKTAGAEGVEPAATGPARVEPPGRTGLATVALLVAALAGLTVLAGPITGHLGATARQMADRAGTVEAVLGEPGGRGRETAR
ncbi:monovalent cation/H+ antiporter subunit D [Prosthecodimorpha staleyi]|uniref:Monovalent cation/H+ antiporter subunit D n=1 Tax=Prosthecodimorpha staleyi TaxID=2840188 RepID=A0A947D815_9HYPH|nr:monovalent cation/H+ antiporter subunit D [Prosthecodimorpha staleyi]MBT9288539.1 monovalent cation/H+ antiporter subunit D [Prosthecodimorpha staleyi]